jgi:hypothetical protein
VAEAGPEPPIVAKAAITVETSNVFFIVALPLSFHPLALISCLMNNSRLRQKMGRKVAVKEIRAAARSNSVRRKTKFGS